jgi:hypothetical protein
MMMMMMLMMMMMMVVVTWRQNINSAIRARNPLFDDYLRTHHHAAPKAVPKRLH